MLALTITPAEFWNHPVYDAAYSGFDPNLVYTSSHGSGFSSGGSAVVNVSAAAIDITARAHSEPSINLATTPLQRFDASVDVTVLENAGATTPFRLGLWAAQTGQGYFVVFEPAPLNVITAQTIADGGSGPTLGGGTVLSRTVLGNYKLGSRNRVTLFVDKALRSMIARISNADAGSVAVSADSGQSPKLFGETALSLSASALPGEGASRVLLQNYRVTLPHERLWASKIADPRAQVALIGLAIAGLLLLAIATASRFRAGHGSVASRIPKESASSSRRFATSPRVIGLFAGAAAVYLIGNAWLFPLGGHPFDMAVEKLYAYVARTYGPVELYYLPNIVTLPKLWQGVPIEEMAFPYEPVMAYLSTGIGWVSSILFAGGGTFSVFSLQLEFLIKAVNVLFGLGDAVLIYLILRQIGLSDRWSLTASSLFLFNPAVWFSMSVWGQTHVISLFFVLAAVLAAEKHAPLWAWLALTAACLTRPQMLVFGLLLAIVFIRKFSWKENASALSWTVILTFLVLTPFTLVTSPSLPIDIMRNTFRAHEAGVPLTFISQDAYSVWPLVEYLTQGASRQHQAFNPNSALVLGPFTYQRLGQILTLAAVLVVAGFLFFRRRATEEAGAYIPYVALGITAFLMLLFGLISTHFLLALPFLLLARRWIGRVAYFWVVVIWTVTTFVTMYGDLGRVLIASDYPVLAPANNVITQFVISLYTNDRFITVGIVANICAVIWLALLTFGQRARPAGPLAAVSK